MTEVQILPAGDPAAPPPLWLLAELTHRCPLHCVFCYNPVDFARRRDELSTSQWIDVLRQEVTEYYSNFRVTPDLIELRNLVEVADLIIRSALHRKESRGLHYTVDYPERDDAHFRHDTVI